MSQTPARDGAAQPWAREMQLGLEIEGEKEQGTEESEEHPGQRGRGGGETAVGKEPWRQVR